LLNKISCLSPVSDVKKSTIGRDIIWVKHCCAAYV
jgi:hypothetical protein